MHVCLQVSLFFCTVCSSSWHELVRNGLRFLFAFRLIVLNSCRHGNMSKFVLTFILVTVVCYMTGERLSVFMSTFYGLVLAFVYFTHS